jgi:predicted nucleic acid-binding protein
MHGIRTPDALQAASCLQLGMDHVFLSGDSTFKRVSGLNVMLVA